MRRILYLCMAVLLCSCVTGCDRKPPAAGTTAVTTTEIVTVAYAPETTVVSVVTTEATTEETTEATTLPVTTVPVTTLPQTTATPVTTVTTPATTAKKPPANLQISEFVPTTLDGAYTYNDGSEPVIEVVDGFTYVNGILIVNKTYSLPETYNPSRLHPDAQAAFDQMQAAAAAEGLKLKIISGFRPYSQQYSAYNNYAARDGKALADRYSARPGHSEHQTGLAMDINSLQQSFATAKEGKWLSEHCAEYGFIIRYGEGKEDKTGFMYEPWHIRYLGVDLAKTVTDSGLCLEEFLGITSVYAE